MNLIDRDYIRINELYRKLYDQRFNCTDEEREITLKALSMIDKAIQEWKD